MSGRRRMRHISLAEEHYAFLNLRAADVIADLATAISFLHSKNASARVILTFSPVLLVATMEDRRYWSPRPIRSPCCVLLPRRSRRSVILSPIFRPTRSSPGNYNRGGYFAEDLRSVTEAGVGVQQIMALGRPCSGVWAAPSVVFGILGDGTTRSVRHREGDPTLNKGFIDRAGCATHFRVYLVNRSGDTLTNFVRTHRGRQLMLQDAVTHLIIASCRNVIWPRQRRQGLRVLSRTSLGCFTRMVSAATVFTALPTTKSTDGWAIRANQTIAHPDQEPQRSLYNDWLRRDWRSVGLTGIFDVAAAVENKATGYWKAGGRGVWLLVPQATRH